VKLLFFIILSKSQKFLLDHATSHSNKSHYGHHLIGFS